jgi:hypothetical protein
MAEQVLALIFDVTSQDRVRVAVHYDGWRPILWLQVGSDGSIYLGPRYKRITTLSRGSVPVEGGQARISYDAGEEIADPAIIREAKLSFHATGIINMADERALRDSLRTLKDQQFLCGMLFQHPSAYAPISVPLKKDICRPYPIDERRPLQAHLYVAPLGAQKIVMIRSAVHQENVLLECRGLQGVPDLVIQICLASGVEGSWPPKSYVFFPAAGAPQDQPPSSPEQGEGEPE